MKTTILITGLLSFSLNAANALPVFTTAPTVTSIDRTATFDSITSNGINLSNYSEDSLFVTVNDDSFIQPAPFPSVFEPGDPRTTGYYYGDGGNFDYVSIRGTDNTSFSAIDFLIGGGTGTTTATLLWETFLGGTSVNSGTELDIAIGTTVGWLDNSGSFDELRVAAYSTATPSFGDFQVIAIDDVRAQVAAVPLPAAFWLMASGIVGLFSFKRKQQA